MADVPLPEKAVIDRHIETGYEIRGYTAEQIRERDAKWRALLDEANRELDALRAERKAAPVAPSEPVAWLLDGTNTVEFERADYHDGDEWSPLYTHPAPVAPAEPPGWALVPRRAGGEMAQAAAQEWDEWAAENRGSFECFSACINAAIAAAPVATAEQCFCDSRGLGVPGVSCGDCPRDYVQAAPVAPAIPPDVQRDAGRYKCLRELPIADAMGLRYMGTDLDTISDAVIASEKVRP